MYDKPTVTVAPSKEVIEERRANTISWIREMERLHSYAQTTPQSDCVARMQVFHDPTTLSGYIVNIPHGENQSPHFENDGASMFKVVCASKVEDTEESGDLEFYFYADRCEIWTWQGFGVGNHPTTDVEVKKLLQIEAVKSIQLINNLVDCKETIKLSGNAYYEAVALNDGLTILKHWIELVTPGMKFCNP